MDELTSAAAFAEIGVSMRRLARLASRTTANVDAVPDFARSLRAAVSALTDAEAALAARIEREAPRKRRAAPWLRFQRWSFPFSCLTTGK